MQQVVPWLESMNRIPFFSSLILAILLGCSGHPVQKRDVIVIVMDTTRADRFGIYGNPHAVTPRINEFAQECEIYDRAWSTASWTLPSHASLL